jgi:DNA-binding response OmpR family regulator
MLDLLGFSGIQGAFVKVLIVDDDPVIATALQEYLKRLGYSPDHVADGLTALGMAITDYWDAILLDVSLPGMDGLTLCRKLRHEKRCDTPIMMLTARDTLDDKLAGFAAGADDYVVKPFALSEVAARLAAISKRAKGQVVPAVLRFADIVLDTGAMRVTRGGRTVKLTAKCFLMLKVLMENPGRVCSQFELEHAVWGAALEDTRTLRTHLHALRRALTANGEFDPIETVLRFGYRMVGSEAAAGSPAR